MRRLGARAAAGAATAPSSLLPHRAGATAWAAQRWRAVRGEKFHGYKGRLHGGLFEMPTTDGKAKSADTWVSKVRVLNDRGAPIVKPETMATLAAIQQALPPVVASAFAHFQKMCDITVPTPVQQVTLPLALKGGRDLCVVAPTGTGKTLCYLLTMISRIVEDSSSPAAVKAARMEEAGREAEAKAMQMTCNDCGLDMRKVPMCSATGAPHPPASVLQETARARIKRQQDEKGEIAPRGIILAPTVLLAKQVEDIIRKFNCGVKAAVLVRYSRVQQWSHIEEVAKKADIVIGTPGSILNALGQGGKLSMKNCRCTVFDEVDALLGRETFQLTTPIMKRVRESQDNQLLAFSASLPSTLYGILKEKGLDRNHRYVAADVPETGHSTETRQSAAAGNITHTVFLVEMRTKVDKLRELVENGLIPKHKNLLIFCNALKTVDYVADEVVSRLEKPNCITLTGTSDPALQQEARNLFESKPGAWCVTTDVGARGIDFADTWVLNWDMPEGPQMYTHRAGRTGRKGKQGVCYSFFMPEEARLARPLCDTLRQLKQPVPQRLAEYARQHYMAHFVANKQYNAQHNKDESNVRFNSAMGTGRKRYPELHPSHHL